jgi:hypothetical protein
MTDCALNIECGEGSIGPSSSSELDPLNDGTVLVPFVRGFKEFVSLVPRYQANFQSKP